MQRILLSLAVLIVCTGGALAQPKFSAIHGASEAKYQEWVGGLQKQKMRPTFVSVAAIKGELLFAAIALENNNRTSWSIWHHLTNEKYNDKVAEQGGKKLRPISVTGYRRGDAVNYAAVFAKDGVESWEARHGQDSKQSQQTFTELVKKEFRPVSIVGYPTADGPRFASIYEKTDGRKWTARTSIPADEYQSLFDDYAKKNARPISVCAFPTKDGTRFGIIMAENTEKLAWSSRHNLSPSQYQEYFDEMTGKGFRPTHVFAYPVEGEARYVAVFVK